jgi:signal transduction histidine kinase
MSAYRILQEALTNVVRHAGPVPVDVEIGYEPGVVRLAVHNGPPSGHRGMGTGSPSGGHGLLGMRERVALFGGSLEAGPCADGGFAVRARLVLSGGAT